MNIPPITLEQVRDEWGACYPAERLAMLYSSPRTVEEVLTKQDEGWEDVPPQDRAWTVAHVLPEGLVRVFALNCAEEVASSVPDLDPRVHECNAVLRDWLAGKADDGELDAAQAAAWAVGKVAVRAVIQQAAQAAVRDATMAAVFSASLDDSREDAWCAAEAASRAAGGDAPTNQLATLLALINGTHKDCWLIRESGVSEHNPWEDTYYTRLISHRQANTGGNQ